MKKNKLSILLIAAAIIVSGAFSSCNKKLKKEIEEMDKEITDLKSQQEATNNNLNSTNDALGFNSPFSMSLTTKDENGNNVSIDKTYKFYSGADYTNISENSDGTWDLYLYVLEAPYWDDDAYMELTYNPTTGAVTNAGADMDFIDSYYDGRYAGLYQSDGNANVSVTVNKFDTSTGVIDVKMSGSVTGASGNVPYSGEDMSVTFQFVGKVSVFKYQGAI